jgi:DNA-binding transcriptional regulator LsrR (DeoR family)
MRPIYDLWKHLDYAVVGIGSVTDYQEIGGIEDVSPLEVIKKFPDSAIGDICARRIDIHGNFIENDFNRKLISITGEELKAARYVMAIAAGQRKILPIVAALRTGTIDCLVTDEKTAGGVLSLVESGQLLD